MSELQPNTPVQYLKGVGPHIAQLLNKKSVYTAWDMLFYLPVKYVDRRKIHNSHTLPIDKAQTYLGEVQKISQHRLGRTKRKVLEITLSDESGQVKISFFKFNESYLRKKYAPGTKVLAFGDVKAYRGFKSMVHPEMDVWDEDHQDDVAKIVPFYSLTEGLYQRTIRRIFEKNLEDLLGVVVDDPLSVRDEGSVQISLSDAFRNVHSPVADSRIDEFNEQRSPYHQRIIYDEFFYLQLGLISKRYKQSQKKAFEIKSSKTLYGKALGLLPFKLTSHQEEALQEIENDFATGVAMNRMLQGDVGSGKTIVAFLSSLMAIESGYQVALMAPTEILAEQHFKNLFSYEEELGIRIELLKGSVKAAQRKRILYDLEQGVVNLLIGTHALLTEDVIFRDLGFVIIDEQHRFGVEQRAQLKNKTKYKQGDISPHLLFMSATPIPRSLSMCVYGDLQLSLIKERPKGRKPITTKVFREKQRNKMYTLIQQELQKGRQAYFVYPLVEESEKLDLKNATLMHQELEKAFPDFKVGLVHGKMKAADKESVMTEYKAGEISILVATTVVEVGVDVPNSTIMVIEHAERFGLAQLHQLRGRVGRGSEQSFCFLMASYAQSEESRFRLKVMEDTNDGFVIAEEDLKLRGPGEFLGTKQSGVPDFRLAQLVKDGHLLKAAKKRAEIILEQDPELQDPKHQKLKAIMMERWGKRLDLSLV
ncbi:MAG: ATP-dependent DNA helicase RecG [Deltaproteobacteria bacterium]|nr:ATP-dependent DNA helicase RecG [Deltaproteobacteria bacterium]